MRAFLDASVLINLLKSDTQTEGKVGQLEKSFSFYTSSINVYEVFKGFYMHEKHLEIFSSKFDILLRNITVLPFDSECAKKAAEIYSALRKKGKPIGEPDYMIAGCALSNGVNTIITGNKKHFEHIKGLKVIVC